MITVQRALWLIRFGTLPSRNSLRPAIPALPTTSTSIAVLLGRLHDRHGRVVVDHHVRVAALAGDLRARSVWSSSAAPRARVRLGRPVLRVGRVARADHLDDVELRLEAVGERRRPRDGALGRLGPVGAHHHALHGAADPHVAVRAHARIIPDGGPSDERGPGGRGVGASTPLVDSATAAGVAQW